MANDGNPPNHAMIPNQQQPTSPFTVVSFNNALKLTPTTYISWTQQVQATLFGFGLKRYVDGTHPCPAAEIITDGVAVPNPAYITWMRQDQLIFGALMGTLSTPLLPLVSCATTSREICTILASTYANKSRGHMLQLKNSLNHITKTTQTISEYMQSIKGYVDKLALMGKPMDPEDIIEKILKGLNQDLYQPVILAVNARDTPISFEELHEKLINHELSLTSLPTSMPFPATVNAAFRGRTPPQPTLLPTPTHLNNINYNRTPRPYLGKCHYCRNVGHVTGECFAFKRAYPNVVFPTYPKPRAPQAHVATLGESSQGWLLDSGATNHVTNDLSNLDIHSPYDGNDELIIGDGTALPIAHIGKFSLHTPTHTFIFHNVLHVPSISRNILSISQFCKDNNTSFEFLPSSFRVKELKTANTSF